MEKNKYLIKNVGILTISNFSSKILVFLLVPFYTSMLTTEEYGFYDMMISTVQLIFPLLSVNIVDSVMRYAIDKEYRLESVISIGFMFVSISAVFAVLILAIIPIDYDNNIKGVVFVYYVCYALNQYLVQLAKGCEKILELGISSVLGTIFMVTGLGLFLFYKNFGLYGFMWANILGLIVPCIYLIYKLKLYENLAIIYIEKKLVCEMIHFSLPLLFTVIGWWINSSFSRYAVSAFIGLAANGILAISYKIPTIINTIYSVFIQAWQVSAIKAYEELDRNRFFDEVFNKFNFILLLVCSVLIFLSKTIAGLLYAKEFYSAWELAPFLLISSIINGAAGFVGPVISAGKNTKAMAMSAFWGALINVGGSLLLINNVGLFGSVIASILSSCGIYYYRMYSVRSVWTYTNKNMLLVSWMILIVQAIMDVFYEFVFGEVVCFALIMWLFGNNSNFTREEDI